VYPSVAAGIALEGLRGASSGGRSRGIIERYNRQRIGVRLEILFVGGESVVGVRTSDRGGEGLVVGAQGVCRCRRCGGGVTAVLLLRRLHWFVSDQIGSGA